MQLSILQARRNERELAWPKIDIDAADRTSEAAHDGELAERRNFARRIQIPLLNFEQFVPNEQLTFRLNEPGCDIVEVDRAQRLIDMQLSRPAGIIFPVPIEDAIRRVAVLLDFDQDIAAADPVKSAGRQKHRVAGFDRKAVNEIGDFAGIDGVLEFTARDRMTQTDEKFCARARGGHVPEFCFRFAA